MVDGSLGVGEAPHGVEAVRGDVYDAHHARRPSVAQSGTVRLPRMVDRSREATSDASTAQLFASVGQGGGADVQNELTLAVAALSGESGAAFLLEQIRE